MKTVGMDEQTDQAVSAIAEIALNNEAMTSDLIQGFREKEGITDDVIFQNFIEEYKKKLVQLKEGNAGH